MLYNSNYFPNYRCGECSVSLAMDHFEEDFKDKYENIDSFIRINCCNCDLYKRDIKIINDEYFIYRNCFIQLVDKENDLYKVVNRCKVFYDIVDACDYIDEIIDCGV